MASGLGATSEIEVLRARLEAATAFEQSLLSTVYWTLGVVAGVLVALIGFSWFVNFRIYERDKDAIRAEVSAVLQSEIHRLGSALESTIASRLERADRALEEGTRLIEKRFASEFGSLRRELAELELRLAVEQAELSAARSSHGNVFTHLIRAAHLGSTLGREYVVVDAVSRIEKHVRSMNGIFATDLQKISNFLDELAGTSSVPVQRLRQVLQESRVL